MSNIWYEVYISNDKEGSHTLENFATLKEAKAFKEYLFRKIDDEETLHIDKWKNKLNPIKIKDIE